MKHNPKITLILLGMFVFVQLLGLYVINSDPFHLKTEVNGVTEVVVNPVLSWMNPPEVKSDSDFGFYLGQIIITFVIAVVLLFFLMKFKIDVVLRVWFFAVVSIALFVTLYALLPKMIFFTILAVILAPALSFLKIFKRNFIIHNVTELLIYPGIAVIFVSLLNFWSAILLLVLISVYDMWAVWHSGIMQKMAKYQMNKLKVFSGFFVPYISKKMRMHIKKMRKLKKHGKIKANIAILGGGDITFPLITAGVIFKAGEVRMPFGLPYFTGGLLPALFVIAGATLGLGLLFAFSQKKKFYPAMPFITAGIFAGVLLNYLLFRIL